MSIRYYNINGNQIPSVTSILDGITEPWVYDWRARELAKAAVDAASPTDLKTKSGKERVVKAAATRKDETALEIGSWAHLLAENHFTNKPQPDLLPKHTAACANLMANFYSFIDAIRPYDVVAVEQQVDGTLYHNELFHTMPFAGTIDTVLDFAGQRWLIDIKSSRKVSDSYAAQVAAYATAWNDTYPDAKVTRLAIARLSKYNAGEWELVTIGGERAMMARELFRTALSLFYIRQKVWGEIINE